MNRRKHLLSAGRIAILSVTLLFSAAFVAVKDDLFLISKNLDIFSAVYRQVSMNYVDDTNPTTLIKTAVDAMLDDLDPYTEYVQETDVEDYKLRYVDTKYGGIGATIFERNGRIYILEAHAGHPADQAGLAAGDELLRINGVSVEGMTTAAVSHMMRGADNSQVQLQARKPGIDEPIELTIARVAIRQPNVSYTAMLDGGIGYIKLDKFLEQSSKEMEKAMNELQRKNRLKGLVVDLRNNGGGILQEAVKIVNLFVPQGELVVSQRGKNSSKTQSYRTMAEPIAPEIPLAILINGSSASAAEIVAGALQDLDRAVVVGERSFGKGLVQQTFNVPYNNLVKVTVAKYYTPSGRCIQATDFMHKDSNGQYNKISDSLIHAFNTKRGRVVYDGSGVYPDLAVERGTYSPITQTLLSRHLIFDYATAFKMKNSRIPEPSEFCITENQYADFIQFLEDKDYNYFTKTEESLKLLKKQAEVEKKPSEILEELASLERKVYQSKQHDLFNHHEEIKKVLGNEIVSRYYYKEGKYAFSLRHDEQLQRTLHLLTTASNEYYSILAGEGTHKVIGQPESLLAALEIID